jgi:hypothetical protein
VTTKLADIRDGALDRAVADRADARYHLAFAGAVDTVGVDGAALPLPVLVSMAAIPAARRAADADGTLEPLVGGAALVVVRRNVSVAEAATMAGLPASTVRDAVDDGRCRWSN